MNRHLLVLPELSALLAVISTPTSAPRIATTLLGKGSTNSARSAARLLSDALVAARRAGVARLTEGLPEGHDQRQVRWLTSVTTLRAISRSLTLRFWDALIRIAKADLASQRF